MKRLILLSAMLVVSSAWATQPGNNGGGNGGCGVGQQTNGCGGTQGEPGPAGPQGPKGDTGAEGPAGPKGDTGATGVDGTDGANGEAGAKGDTGAQGPQGVAGRDVDPATVRNLQSQIERNDKRASAGNAGAIAFASIPQVIETGTSGVGAGTGCYRGECGLAIGASYRTKDGKWILKGGATVDTRGGAGVGAGALFTWK